MECRGSFPLQLRIVGEVIGCIMMLGSDDGCVQDFERIGFCENVVYPVTGERTHFLPCAHCRRCVDEAGPFGYQRDS